jgi:hypothetical protein
MSSQQWDWQWDAVRQKYYVYSAVEDRYVYQDGTRVRKDGTEEYASSFGFAR